MEWTPGDSWGHFWGSSKSKLLSDNDTKTLFVFVFFLVCAKIMIKASATIAGSKAVALKCATPTVK